MKFFESSNLCYNQLPCLIYTLKQLQTMITYFVIDALVLLAYLAYKLFIKPMRMRAYYAKVFRENGYKVFELPYQVLKAPFFLARQTDLKQKGDFNYTGKHIYSDNYDLLVSNALFRPQLVFFNQKLIRGFLEKQIQMKLPKMNTGFDCFKFITRKSLAFQEKNSWKHRRALLSKIFNFDFVSSQIPTMVKNANLIHQQFQQQHWAQHPQKIAQRKISISLYDMISTYTSAIITAGFLGMDSMKDKLNGSTIQKEILELAHEGIALSRDPLILLFGKIILKLGLRQRDRQFVQKNHEISEILRSQIQNYRRKIQDKVQEKIQKPKSIIELILKEIEKEKENPSGNKEAEITDEDLIDQLKGFVIAGTDTTSNYLTNLILFIYEHPHVLQKLRAQIDTVIKSDADITYDNMKKLTYFELVLQESSRVLGASEGGFQRVLQEDASICDMPIFKDTCLNVYTRPMLSNPKNFKDPFTFRPQRWEGISESEEGKRQLQLISYQFYGGPRSCIGRQLALTETKVKVIKFLKRYKSLVEPGVNNRKYAFELTAHLVNSDVILQTFE